MFLTREGKKLLYAFNETMLSPASQMLLTLPRVMSGMCRAEQPLYYSGSLQSITRKAGRD